MERINIMCITCNKIYDIAPSTYKRYKKKEYRCKSCVQQEVWKNPELLKIHSEKIKKSDKYREGIKNRKDVLGENNPRYGVKVSDETRKKMSLSRTGKTGENATAWKGGKESVYRLVKSAVFRRFLWGNKVKDRDKKCMECGNTKNLDAHHVKPFKIIFDEISLNKPDFETSHETIEWYLKQDDIIDLELKNGICLCRKCHKLVHDNWGSHSPK